MTLLTSTDELMTAMAADTDFLERLESRPKHARSRPFDSLKDGRRQIWECGECELVRQWGLGTPWDSTLKPQLKCAGCRTQTRHYYVGVI